MLLKGSGACRQVGTQSAHMGDRFSVHTPGGDYQDYCSNRAQSSMQQVALIDIYQGEIV